MAGWIGAHPGRSHPCDRPAILSGKVFVAVCAEAAGGAPAGLPVAAMLLWRSPLLSGDPFHQCPEFLLPTWIVGDLEFALGVADEAVGRADPVVLLDQQAVRQDLEHVSLVWLPRGAPGLDLDRDDDIALAQEEIG